MGKRHWNVIFLLDQTPPANILLLKRASTKTFAPNLYTGIGGKIEPRESILESSYRELNEETNLTGIKLIHFADCVIDSMDTISILYGLFEGTKVPECNEGKLEWVLIDHVFKKDLIPTARYYLTEWQRKKFSLTEKWSVYLRETGRVNGVRLADIVEVRNGLYTTEN
jgi:8-oxo-dGTP pyrophosphatase MutT (NUDIX family)